jgi:L-ribulose-5-phosphate 3-epimerase UlaE
MKLNNSFVTRQFRDTYVMTGTEEVAFKGVVNGNGTTAFVIECLKNEITRDAIIEKMAEKYDAPREIITEDVDKVLDALRSIGAIEE